MTKKQRAVSIYALTSPDGEIRYVGQTVKRLQRRLRLHITNALKLKTYKDRWIVSLLSAGQRPDIELLEVVFSKRQASRAEREWIAGLPNLTNGTRGGEGTLGWIPSVETRAKISASKLGVKNSLEHNEAIRLGHLGLKQSLEHIAARSGWRHTEEAKEKIRQKQFAYHARRRGY